MGGSKVLKPRPTGITWKSGSVVNVSWYIAYNHAGGYKYRVCPASEPLSEECFARPEHQLEFVSNTSVVKFKSGDRRIPNTVIREGGGIGWMLNPIPMPNFVGSDCDNMDGKPCHGCPCGSHYPGGNDENGVCVDGLCYGITLSGRPTWARILPLRMKYWCQPSCLPAIMSWGSVGIARPAVRSGPLAQILRSSERAAAPLEDLLRIKLCL